MRRRSRLDDYTRIPTEREANRAAGAYARAQHPHDVAALAADDRFRQFVEEPAPVDNLLEETVQMIWQYVYPDDVDDEDDGQRAFGIVVQELEGVRACVGANGAAVPADAGPGFTVRCGG